MTIAENELSISSKKSKFIAFRSMISEREENEKSFKI